MLFFFGGGGGTGGGLSVPPLSVPPPPRGSVTVNVLAALATGGLGVSGLEPACGLPYPTPAPPSVSRRSGKTSAMGYVPS